MNQDQLKQEALQREALLESMFSKEDLKKIQQFNPVLAKSFLASAQLQQAEIELIEPSSSTLASHTIGYVYILKNSFMPGLVKIGYTDRDPFKQSLELSSFNGVPGRFKVVFSWHVSDAAAIEKKLHSELVTHHRGDEFFELEPTVACEKVRDLLMDWNAIGKDGLSFEEAILARAARGYWYIDKTTVRRLKFSLFRKFFVDLVTSFQLGRLVDMVDLALSSPGTGTHQLTFADLVHYQQRYSDSRTDLIQLIYQLQIVIYGTPRLDRGTLERIQAETFERCSKVNAEFQRLVLSNQVSSISGPNPHREFIAAVSQRLETLDGHHN
jgi:hypothetical protein